MSVRLACADFSFPLLSHRLVMRLISDLECEAVDIGLFAGGSQLSPRAATSNPHENAREISKLITDVGLALADVFVVPGPFDVLAANHPDVHERSKSRELFSRSLDFINSCGGRHFTALPGIPWEGEPRESSLARAADELAWRVENASAAGVV